MALSYYKERANGDYLTVGLWDFNDDPVFAEATDEGNTSGWGLNHNWREIAEAITDIHIGLALSKNTSQPSQLDNLPGLWLKDEAGENYLYFKDIAKIFLGNEELATQSYVQQFIQGLDWQESVLNKDLTAPPENPNEGDRYLLYNEPDVGTAWEGHKNEIAEWNGTTWEFTVPNKGFTCEVEDEAKYYTFNGTDWILMANLYSHNVLADLQGGQADEYYHLTAQQHSDLTAFQGHTNAQLEQLNSAGSPTFVNLHLTDKLTIDGDLDINGNVVKDLKMLENKIYFGNLNNIYIQAYDYGGYDGLDIYSQEAWLYYHDNGYNFGFGWAHNVDEANFGYSSNEMWLWGAAGCVLSKSSPDNTDWEIYFRTTKTVDANSGINNTGFIPFTLNDGDFDSWFDASDKGILDSINALAQLKADLNGDVTFNSAIISQSLHFGDWSNGAPEITFGDENEAHIYFKDDSLNWYGLMLHCKYDSPNKNIFMEIDDTVADDWSYGMGLSIDNKFAGFWMDGSDYDIGLYGGQGELGTGAWGRIYIKSHKNSSYSNEISLKNFCGANNDGDEAYLKIYDPVGDNVGNYNC